MAFQPPEVKTPTTIQRITYVLSDREATDEHPASKTATFQLVLLDQNGRPMPYENDIGNLVPHLDADDVDWLVDYFAPKYRALAEAAILP